MALRQITRNIVGGIIISLDNKVLFGRQDRGKGGVYIDCWHIPGGGIEDGETKEMAIAREILEETGIDIKGSKLELVDDTLNGTAEKTLRQTGEKVICNMNFNSFRIFLNQNSNDILLSANDDLVNLKWFDITKVSTVKLTPPSISLFKMLGYL